MTGRIKCMDESYHHNFWIQNLEVKAGEEWRHAEGQPDVPLVQ